MIDRKEPMIFDEFFASGKEESISPFLTPSSRRWSRHLSLKTSCLAALLLLLSFALSTTFAVASNVMLLFVYFLVGTPALIDAISDIRNLEINIDVLMTLAALLSVLIGSGFEGALLLVLFELSAAMENSVTQKTKGALTHLHHLCPRGAFFLTEDGNVREKSVKDIAVGDKILVKAGEIVPLDGTVISGRSHVNLSHLTGESLPLVKKLGDEVQAGSRNLDGTLTMQVTRTSSDSTLARIMQLITEAQEARPQVQKIIDRFGDKYALSIMSLSLLFAVGLPFLSPSLPYLGTEGAVYRALTFLIAASPCALVIATPTAYLSAISSCAKKGIMLKGGVVLDALSSCKGVAFDKTGTLTTGQLRLIDFVTIQSTIPSSTALRLAASVEQHVVHPIATALLEYAKEQNAPIEEVENFSAVAGFGVQAEAKIGKDNYSIFIGHYGFVKEHFSVALKQSLSNYLPSTPPGKVTTFILINDSLFSAIFSDDVKSSAKDVVVALRDKLKMHVTMLTGDHQNNALSVAKAVGIENVHADLRPQDKLQIVSDLSKEEGLIMLGDGINDAPALMRASVGISMGKIGSATAIDASDVVLLQDDLSSLPWLIKKSHKTLSVIKQNLILALSVILFATTPALLGFIPLWVAVLLHEGGTILVGLNSLRLLKK